MTLVPFLVSTAWIVVASGYMVREHLPMLAQRSERWALVRSLTHPSNDHSLGHHIMLTGRTPAPRHPPQDENRDRPQGGVEQHDEAEGEPFFSNKLMWLGFGIAASVFSFVDTTFFKGAASKKIGDAVDAVADTGKAVGSAVASALSSSMAG